MTSLPLFGSPLITALARSSFTTPSGLSIPGILARTIHEIEEKGLDIEGIFRKSGSTAVVNQLQAQFEENHNPFLINFPSTISTHSLAGLFKRYLQQLPEPVIPRKFQPLFLDIFDEEKCTKETLKRRLKELCKKLPHEHLHLLQFLMEVADTVQQHQAKNQMSIASLAIIFAPTCVHIDGVSQLMPHSTSSHLYPSQKKNTSYTSLPVVLSKQHVLRKARQLLLNTLRIKSNDRVVTFDNSILYKPNDLLQLELIKTSNTWVRIFEFMMTYPEVFTTLTNPLKSQKYQQQQRSATTIKSNVTLDPVSPKEQQQRKYSSEMVSPDVKTKSYIIPSFSQVEKKMLMDFKQLEFTDNNDFVKTFESFDFYGSQQQSNRKQNRKSSRSNSISSNKNPSKYVETLLNWKSREVENPNVIIPQVVIKRPTSSIGSRPSSPQPSDWIKALSGGAFEPSIEKKNRKPSLFIHIDKNNAAYQ